jgi:hypothetical protein
MHSATRAGGKLCQARRGLSCLATGGTGKTVRDQAPVREDQDADVQNPSDRSCANLHHVRYTYLVLLLVRWLRKAKILS